MPLDFFTEGNGGVKIPFGNRLPEIQRSSAVRHRFALSLSLENFC